MIRRVRNTLRATLVVGGLSLVTIGSAGLASAQAQSNTTHNAASTRNCAVFVPTGAEKCFSTFREALSQATAGTVNDAPDNARDAVRDADLMARLDQPKPLATVTIGIEYQDSNYNGDSISYYGTSGCTVSTSNIDWEVSNLGTIWNNRISSFVTRNQCDQEMFDGTGFTTSLTGGYWDHATGLGSGNDKTSSIRWS